MAFKSFFLSVFLLVSAVGFSSAWADDLDPVPERQLLNAIERVQQGEFSIAMEDLDRLTMEHPNFQLAQVVKADLLLARAQGLTEPGQGVKADSKRKALIAEAKARIKALNDRPELSKLPAELVQLGADVDVVVLVEKARNRLLVYRLDAKTRLPELVYSRYASTGRAKGDKRREGDLKTPEGVYFVDGWIPDRKLAEKYGRGALTLNYPNELDRKLRKTGHGIWIHGLESDRYSRPPLDSEGCVVLPNADFLRLKKLARPGRTPVVIGEHLRWLSKEQWKAEAERRLAVLDAWRADWESLDVEAYLSHYGGDFWAKGHDLSSWKARKRRVASRKQFQQVELKNLTLLAYPQGAGEGTAMMVAIFDQRYRSNNYNSDSRKKMYWEKRDGVWRIRFEGELEPR